MNSHHRTTPLLAMRPAAAATRACMMLALAALPMPTPAVQATTHFDVMITLSSVATRPQTGTCNSTAAETIVCNSLGGRELQASAPARSRFDLSGYRFISYVSGLAGSVDIYTNAGTSTAFRLVNWADREYIEMTVGW